MFLKCFKGCLLVVEVRPPVSCSHVANLPKSTSWKSNHSQIQIQLYNTNTICLAEKKVQITNRLLDVKMPLRKGDSWLVHLSGDQSWPNINFWLGGQISPKKYRIRSVTKFGLKTKLSSLQRWEVSCSPVTRWQNFHKTKTQFFLRTKFGER